jgi:hypothetical protein
VRLEQLAETTTKKQTYSYIVFQNQGLQFS